MLYKLNEKSNANFAFQNDFIQYEKNNDLKLCISIVFEKKIFKMIYNNNVYEN